MSLVEVSPAAVLLAVLVNQGKEQKMDNPLLKRCLSNTTTLPYTTQQDCIHKNLRFVVKPLERFIGFLTTAVAIQILVENTVRQKINFCDQKMCPHQGIHVACNKTKAFSKSCEGTPKLEKMAPHISLILYEHNYYRNLVAGGKLKCFYPAARMPLLKWDWALAETAEYNVRSCVFAHDHCRSTKEFPLAGQNIYMAKTSRLNVTVDEFITEAIFLWFEEQFDADHKILLSYHKTIPQTGHFTMLVNDRQTRVGCAFLNNLQPPRKRFVIFTCNYSSTNIRDRPSYKPGKPASMCKKRHHKFKALCEDPIDPNDYTWYNI